MASGDPSSDPKAALDSAIRAATGSDLDRALGSILDAGVALLRPAVAAILLQDPDRPGLTVAASHGLDEQGMTALAVAAAEVDHPFADAVRDRMPVFDRAGVDASGAPVVGAYLPMVVDPDGTHLVLGALGMTWTNDRVLSDVDRDTLTSLAAIAAVTADRARLGATAAERSEWFERMAHTDPLTGIANERTIARLLELELARAARQGGEVSLAIFDIDDFRATNTEGGHSVGDDVLRRVAAVLAESVRLVDTVGRIGGDEFVVVAPGSAGGTVARRILDGIEALPIVAGRAVSVSAGVVRFPVDGADTESLIAAALAALERAKAAGRGELAEGEPLAGGVAEG